MDHHREIILSNETKKMAHDSQIVRAKENLKLSHGKLDSENYLRRLLTLKWSVSPQISEVDPGHGAAHDFSERTPS